MARKLRIEIAGGFYHVTARGNEQKEIFFSDDVFCKFKEYLSRAILKFDFSLHCYVLMSNHYHLVIETNKANLGRIMQYLNGAYSTYINIVSKRSGHLFQGRYKSYLVDKDTYLLELSRYVHNNPVRASMVKHPEDYRFRFC